MIGPDRPCCGQPLTFPTPIQHVIVIVKENRTFDNYFTGFPHADSSPSATLFSGPTIQRPFVPDGGILSRNPCHSHDCAVTAYDYGFMDGFDVTQPEGADHQELMRFHPGSPSAYWDYAANFVIGDHHFTTLAGPSTPNHFAIIASQTPFYDNPSCTDCSLGKACGAPDARIPTYDQATCTPKGNRVPCFDVPSVVDDFDARGLTWRSYSEPKWNGLLNAFRHVKSIGLNATTMANHLRPSTQFLADVEAGDIPNFMHVDSLPGLFQEGPQTDPCFGEQHTVDIVDAVMKGPRWYDTAIVITWDDWGGLYDHVAPNAEYCDNGQFYNPGFRVPILIISAWAKRGYVLSNWTEHASIPKLVEDLFGLPYMSTRDPNARDGRDSTGSLMEAFDFTKPPRPPVHVNRPSCP